MLFRSGGYVHWMMNQEEFKRKNRWDIFDQQILDADLRSRISLEEGDLWHRRKYIQSNYLGYGRPDTMQLYALSSLYSNAYHLIWDELRAGTAQGHEVLFPFLDYRFYQFIAGIPTSLYPELFYDKSILRIPSRSFLPKVVTEKKKVPINPPEKYDQYTSNYQKLLTASRFALLEEAFGSLDKPHEIINKKALEQMVSGQSGLQE